MNQVLGSCPCINLSASTIRGTLEMTELRTEEKEPHEGQGAGAGRSKAKKLHKCLSPLGGTGLYLIIDTLLGRPCDFC